MPASGPINQPPVGEENCSFHPLSPPVSQTPSTVLAPGPGTTASVVTCAPCPGGGEDTWTNGQRRFSFRARARIMTPFPLVALSFIKMNSRHKKMWDTAVNLPSTKPKVISECACDVWLQGTAGAPVEVSLPPSPPHTWSRHPPVTPLPVTAAAADLLTAPHNCLQASVQSV